MNRVAIIGLGKAGLPLACVVANSGLNTVGFDINKEHVNKISNKINPIPEEPGVTEILNDRIGKNFSVTSNTEDISNANAYIVIVPLFIDEQTKTPDFSILKSAFTNIGKLLSKGNLVVLETTVPPKTTETLIKDILEKESGLIAGTDFHLAYSPERIMTGYSISRYKEFPKVVGGLTKECGAKAHELYSNYCQNVEIVSDSKTAELIKVSEGVYRDVNIGLANELYKICENLDINFYEMKEKANHAFCNIHEPGNVGGHCIPVYPWFLINNKEFQTDITKTARELNDDMIFYYIEKIKKISPSGKVLVIGLTYREGVKEKAYTRSIPLINELKKVGYEVFGLDPMYSEDETKSIFEINHLDISELSKVDAIIVMNNNKEYLKELIANKDKVVFVKNMLKN